VRINGGRNVQAFKITTADSSGFNTVFVPQTDSILWQPLRDDPTTWDMGALNRSINTADPYDYGWGTYNTVTHHIPGDSLYAIRTLNGTWKKLRIQRLAYDTTWYITYADMNGSNLTTLAINKQDFPGKNFVYLSLNGNAVNDSEPAAWDLLFTRYLDFVSSPMGSAWYPVTGVLANKGVQAVKATEVDIAAVSFAPFSSSLSSNINTIGYDWKFFAGTGFEMVDSLVYFVKAKDNNIYRLRFLNYKSANAESVFELQYIQPSLVNGVGQNLNLLVYPNPAADVLQLVDFGASSETGFSVYDAMGTRLISGSFGANGGSAAIDVSGLANGCYFIQLLQNGSTATRSFVVNR